MLADHSTIALDACTLIYYLEGNPAFIDQAQQIVSRIIAGHHQAIIATMALLEVQVGPYAKHNLMQVEDYYDLLLNLPNVHWMPLSVEIADKAAQLRATHRFKTPDAVHLATAIESGATLFVTHDHDLPRVDSIEYLMLDE